MQQLTKQLTQIKLPQTLAKNQSNQNTADNIVEVLACLHGAVSLVIALACLQDALFVVTALACLHGVVFPVAKNHSLWGNPFRPLK